MHLWSSAHDSSERAPKESFKFKLTSPDVSITFLCIDEPSISRIMQSVLSANFPPFGLVTVKVPPGATLLGVTVSIFSSSSRHNTVTASKNTIAAKSSHVASFP